MVFWPQDSKCYTLHTRGPCAKGKLITLGKSKIAECKVRHDDDKADEPLSIESTSFKTVN